MNLYIIMATVNPGVTITDVQNVLKAEGANWYRIAPNVWILWSGVGADGWSDRLAPLVRPMGGLFVSRLDLFDNQGWMTKKFWSWLRSRKGESLF